MLIFISSGVHHCLLWILCIKLFLNVQLWWIFDHTWAWTPWMHPEHLIGWFISIHEYVSTSNWLLKLMPIDGYWIVMWWRALHFCRTQLSNAATEASRQEFRYLAESQKLVETERRLYQMERQCENLRAELVDVKQKAQELILKYEPGGHYLLQATKTYRRDRCIVKYSILSCLHIRHFMHSDSIGSVALNLA